jgi:uncharacterized protein (DUF2236 family)
MAQRGYFRPDSMIWRVSREGVLMLGGGRALLMQAAHPLAVAGVADHSDYRENPWLRLERTMSAVWTVVYGTREEADRVGNRVKAVHRQVRGRLTEAAGPYPAGTGYRAEDPDLLMWVHASLVDTALLMYRSYVSPLSEDEMESYYQDMKVLAMVFGTPQSAIPDSMAAFRTYMSERLRSDAICVTDTAREVTDTVLNPPVPLPLRPAFQAINFISAGFLPEKLRREYGFSWDPARRALLAASAQYVRRVLLPLTPQLIRAIPPARRADRRVAADLAGPALAA